MAKATAVCTCAKCGATFEVTAAKYNRRKADSWKAWAESNYDECPDCYKIRKQQEREAANTAAAEKAKGAGLPDLTGSEKQIAWATKIRQDFIDEYFPLDQLTEEGRGILMIWLGEHPDSRFWIDNRELTGTLYMKFRKWYENRVKTENTPEGVSSVASSEA